MGFHHLFEQGVEIGLHLFRLSCLEEFLSPDVGGPTGFNQNSFGVFGFKSERFSTLVRAHQSLRVEEVTAGEVVLDLLEQVLAFDTGAGFGHKFFHTAHQS